MRTFFLLACGFCAAGLMWAAFFYADSWLARRELERARARFMQQRLEGRRP